MSNRLSKEHSPYLLQHADNPVDWRPWGPEVFEEARRADVDAVYMAACVAMNGSGGWPLTVLLTPDQKLFWAGTYLPKGQLLHLLQEAARLWREDRAGLVLDDPRYLDAARRTADFLAKKLTGPDGRLLARWRDGDAAHPGKLDDYAFYACGLLELYGTTFDISYLSRTGSLAGQLLEFFFDWEHGGFYPYASDGEQLLTRTKEAYDGAMPSGNSVAALVLSRLARLTGEGRWREAGDRQLRWLAGTAADYPAGHSFAMLAFLEELWPSAELVAAAQEISEELRAFLREKPHPGLTVLVKTVENTGALAAAAPFTKSYPIPEQGARYYLCRNGACAQPVDRISELEALWDPK